MPAGILKMINRILKTTHETPRKKDFLARMMIFTIEIKPLYAAG
jgi:hypothetical protein